MQKKKFIDSIRVEKPCAENWDEMTGNDRVRFCSHCSKDVNNISKLTIRQAEKLVRKSGGRLCVRYRVDPRSNAPMFARRLSSVARHSLAAGTISASLLAATAYPQKDTNEPQMVQIDRVQKQGGASAALSGYVTDPNGAALPFALVSIINEETLASQIQNASAEGFYEFKDLEAGKYKIRFEAGGFASTEVSGIYVADASVTRQDGNLGLSQVEVTVQVNSDEYSIQGGLALTGVIDISVAENRNDLVTAVLEGDFENVKARIMMRARVNVRDKSREGMSPLHAAVETGNLEIAEYLLNHGAKPNIRDYEKQTPLMMMDSDATPEMFDLLLRYGAKLNLLDKAKNNILHHAAGNEVPVELIRRISNYGLNVNAINKEGRTALMMAAENGYVETAKALIESGADVNVQTRDGHTALSLISDSDADTRSLLETYGALRGSR